MFPLDTSTFEPTFPILIAGCNHETDGDYIFVPSQNRCNIQGSLEFASKVGSIKGNHRSHKLKSIIHESRKEVNALKLKGWQM
jgi:hypothetical protein